jgi:hypothetical protein
MRDWNSIAKATLPDISPQDLARLVEPLSALEEVFRPLVRDLRPDLEPATGLHFERDAE